MKPINVMLFLSWTGLLLFFTWLPFAESSEIMRKTVYSCMLNKSFTMNVIVESNENGVQQAVLEERHFLLPEPRIMATLSKPTLVDYGGIFMLLRDEGRSGYFFLRIQPAESSSTLLEGLMDNNLFNDHSGHFTAGQLQKMPCMRR